jgi:hypothetical protein
VGHSLVPQELSVWVLFRQWRLKPFTLDPLSLTQGCIPVCIQERRIPHIPVHDSCLLTNALSYVLKTNNLSRASKERTVSIPARACSCLHTHIHILPWIWKPCTLANTLKTHSKSKERKNQPCSCKNFWGVSFLNGNNRLCCFAMWMRKGRSCLDLMVYELLKEMDLATLLFMSQKDTLLVLPWPPGPCL